MMRSGFRVSPACAVSRDLRQLKARTKASRDLRHWSVTTLPSHLGLALISERLVLVRSGVAREFVVRVMENRP